MTLPIAGVARQWLTAYEQNSGRDIQKTLLDVQARRSALIVRRLKAGTGLVLPDPVGTGKTAVALVAAGMLLEKGSIRGVVVVAPNSTVQALWRRRVGWLRSPSGRRFRDGTFLVVTRKSLPDRRPNNASRALVIVDEAHRGLQAEGDFHEALERWTKGCQVLLVTATPFLLSTQGLTTMLKIGQGVGNDDKRPVEDYGRAVTDLAKEYRNAVHRLAAAPATEPSVTAALERAIGARGAAEKVLRRRILKGDKGLDEIREKPPILRKECVSVDPGWEEAYHVARVIPELVEGGKGDMFNRRLLSSSEAFLNGTAGKKLHERAIASEEVRRFEDELATSLGCLSDHPKVLATARWASERASEGRHVLVFCVFTETQDALKRAIEQHLGSGTNVDVVAPQGASIKAASATRFQDPKEPPLVLVLQDRFSESIDLDGGRPCLVHHDLPWTPARVTQRWGRVVRAGSGFSVVAKKDIYVPVLQLDADRRLFDTVKARATIGDVLLPPTVLVDLQDPDSNEYALPDAILDALRR